MQFIIIATDHTDAEALSRRIACRDAHVAMISKYKNMGHMLMGVALLDENNKMKGSVVICDFPDRAGLDQWLQEEPYITNNVWGDVQIHNGSVGPSFL